ncbi:MULTISPECIES: autotransporter outer membrane beta-barrel domain-containing protein [unclassified Variovorax]|uniref:autotransporter outer membrane beta-barrel domain-containing protein n=1 Tax=unclassified Variovorax TaxID=663243 RepID=UPI0008D28650|nr:MULTISPECIES: autotransporter outer membrane beta-barrel domain-containing protein [unclassified Variovorax]SEK16410.1 outer membrane autotransporter barrel domain-containing protein [Variovorax sp. OK202]SFE45667.1 outer membrane autotransporter barrel domain-containing protein [Variovorax sp. OK212]
MNISYRSVWNRSIGAWVAVSEVVRGRGKRGRGGRSRGAAVRALAVAALALTGAGSHAQTIVDDGPLVVGSDAQLGADSVVVDNTLNRNATLKINSGVSIGNEIILNNGGTLNNAGTISRTAVDDTAVRSDVGGATVNNAATGRIVGEYIGVSLSDGGTVTNTGGTISAAAADGDDKGVYIWGKTGTVTNEAGGTITAQSIGVQLAAGGSVTNDASTIEATGSDGSAVYIHDAPGDVTNKNAGLITGVRSGVNMEAGGTVSNIGAGSVIGASGVGGTGVAISGGNGTVTNSGTIEASGVDGQGVVIGGGTAQVTNSGTIQAPGSGGRAIYLYADPGDTLTVNNQAGGKITGAGTGVQLNGNGTVTNSGEISTTAADGMGVYFGTAAGAVVNTQAGTITGGAAGVLLDFSGDVTNTGGTIRATTDGKNLDGGHGVAIVGGLGTVTNQGGGTIMGKLYGVSLADGGTITNTASTISADGMDPLAAGVGISGAPGTVTNTGAGSLIKGPAAGVRLINGGTVINGAGATIQGKSAVEVIAGNATLSNAGALVGNVVLRGASTNKVTLFTGSSITGNLGIGTNAASTLTLDGLGDQLYSNAVTGTTTLGSGSVVKVGSGTWTLDKAMTRSGATQVAAGTLVVANNTALGTGSVTVDDTGKAAATLQVDAGFSITNQVVVNNGGTLNNSGTVTRTGANQIAVETKAGGGTINNTGGRLAATGTNTMGVKVTNGVGTVTNQTGGTIAGGEAGIWLTGGGSVRNTGAGSAISSGANASLGYGVYATSATASVTVTNEAGASIAGKASGVYLGAGGSVINDGLASKISADANGSVGVSIGALSSTALGVVNNLNGATIEGVNGGVVLYNGGEILNDVGSVIKANTAVIVMSGGTRLTNKGQLIGGVNLNFRNPPQAHQVTLFTGSSITGSLGIGSNAASTLTLDGTGQQFYSNAVGDNTSFSAGTLVKQGMGTWTLDKAMTRGGATQVAAGTLAVAHGSGLGSGTVTVDNTDRLGATLAVDSGVSIGNAVIVNNTGTLNNAGTISQTAAGQKAVISETGGATVNNAATGRVEGDKRGVDLADGGTVTNTGGTIQANAAGSYGAVTGGVAATVNNTLGGTISGVQAGVAVWGSGGNTVDNNGAAITASIGNAVYVQNSGTTVTNRGGGKITGKASGVFLVSGGTLINDADSTIEGTAGVAVASNAGGTAVTLRNAGKLIGDVNLPSSEANEAHEVTLYTGSSIMGRLQANSQASTLTLDGVGDQLYAKAVTGTTTFTGSLVKRGLGNWTLDQTQNGLTTGNARVEGGTLNVGTRLDSASVNVLSGATLAGGGTLAGAVKIADGGHLALLSGSTLSAASLVLGANSNLDVALGAPSDTRLLNLAGDLTLDGKLNVTDAGGFGRGAYRLIDYGGSLTDNGLDLGNLPLGYKAGDMAVQTSVDKQVNLVVGSSSGTLRFWNGNVLQPNGKVNGGSGVWNAGDSNWTTTDGTASQAWAHDFGVFNGTGGTVTMNGAQKFSGLQFAVDGYELVSGAGGKLTALNDSDGYAQIRVDPGVTARIAVAIDGDGQLDKRDRGTLVLSGNNSYTGGTAVHGGTLVAGSNTALGTGTVTVDNAGDFGARLQIASGLSIANEIILNNLGRLDNAGLIERTAPDSAAVHSQTGGAIVNNLADGVISGYSQGVMMDQGGTVNNQGGKVRALTTGNAIETSGAAGTVNNTGGGMVSGRFAGVAMYAGGKVSNIASTIFADMQTASGVYIEGGDAIVSNTGGGRIEGGGTGINTSTNTATVINGVGSTIKGQGVAVHAFRGDVTLSNSGQMFGNVFLDGTGTHKITLYTGSSVTGDLRIGTNAATTLTLDGAGSQRYSDAVTGATIFNGTLIKQGSGTWTLDRASARSGGTSLKAGRLNLGDSMALGTGTLSMDDGTTLGFAADGLTIANAIHMTGSNDPVIDTGAFNETLAGVISGGGFLTKQGTGTLTLAGANVYTGATNVAAGTLRAGAANTFASSSAHSVAAGATLDTDGFNQTVAALANAGTVNLRSAGGAVGSTLTVTGPYVGNNGVLQVATALGDSTSISDRLLLSGAGAVASGSTQVKVTNVAGLGALTTGNGIPVVVTEKGARIEANAFSLPGGHVDAGAFEYRLTANASGAWLNSNVPPVDPMNPADPVSPANPVGSGTPGPSAPLYRAEVPLIAALPEQLREANLAMLANRSQRVGDSVGANAPAGSRQAWGRVLSVQRDIAQGGAVSPHSRGRLTGFQAGTDLFVGGSADAQWQVGVYVGQLDGDMSASGFARGIANLQAGRNTLRNQYLGAYGSYQGSSGLYAEAVLQAARHRYGVEAITSSSANGKGSSLLASLEVGQSFELAPGWRVEPQLQLIHQSLDLNDLALGGLTTVGQNTKSGWSLRTGIRVQGELATAIGTLKPYGRLNVYKSPNGTDSASYRTPAALTVIGTPTGGTRTEVAMGATLALSERTSLYGEIGQLNASGGNTRTEGGVNASVGLKMRW